MMKCYMCNQCNNEVCFSTHVENIKDCIQNTAGAIEDIKEVIIDFKENNDNDWER